MGGTLRKKNKLDPIDSSDSSEDGLLSGLQAAFKKDTTTLPLPYLPLDVFRVIVSFLDFRTALRYFILMVIVDL